MASLNAPPPPPPPKGEVNRGDVRSVWSLVRRTIRHLGVELGYVDDHLTVEFDSVCSRTPYWHPVAAMLKKAKEARRLQQVLASSDEGRSFHCISLHPSSSHWIPTGRYVSFAEYKFALRARLNMLPVMFGPLIDAPPSHPDTTLTTLTYMQRSLIDMDMKCIHLLIDMQLFAVMKQVCWYQPMQFKNVVVHLRWLHCKADEEFRARSVRGCSIRRTDWYYRGNITIITFTGISIGSPW